VAALEEFGPDAAGPTALSPVGMTHPFRILGDEGAETLRRICDELRGAARDNGRLPKCARGVAYRSEFIRGLVSDPLLLDFLRSLARAPLEVHPVTHHAAQLNFAPDDLSQKVDQWHHDAVAFAVVMMVSDPRRMKGGQFQYFWGSVEEGKELLLSGKGLPPERVRHVEFPGAGWAMLMQGHRVLHQAARLLEPGPRTTLVASYWAPHPEIDDPTDLGTLRKADGREIALVEWSRYAARVASRKLERFAMTRADFSRSLQEVRDGLRASIAGIEAALAEFDSRDEGRFISFEESRGKEP
jgi:hypothetical protein